MYVIRRVYKVKPGQTKKAAELIYKIGSRFTEAGQRDQVRVYWSGYTMPGPPNTVYMEWTQEKIESPYREGTSHPEWTTSIRSSGRSKRIRTSSSTRCSRPKRRDATCPTHQ